MLLLLPQRLRSTAALKGPCAVAQPSPAPTNCAVISLSAGRDRAKPLLVGSGCRGSGLLVLVQMTNLLRGQQAAQDNGCPPVLLLLLQLLGSANGLQRYSVPHPVLQQRRCPNEVRSHPHQLGSRRPSLWPSSGRSVCLPRAGVVTSRKAWAPSSHGAAPSSGRAVSID